MNTAQECFFGFTRLFLTKPSRLVLEKRKRTQTNGCSYGTADNRTSNGTSTHKDTLFGQTKTAPRCGKLLQLLLNYAAMVRTTLWVLTSSPPLTI